LLSAEGGGPRDACVPRGIIMVIEGHSHLERAWGGNAICPRDLTV